MRLPSPIVFIAVHRPGDKRLMNSLLSDRVPYSAIVDRPRLALPDEGRLLVWIIVNVEHWTIERAMPRTVLGPPIGHPQLPNSHNWALQEYGMRVGFWRILEALKQRHITPTMAINGLVCKTYPRIAEAAQKLDWEFIGQGYLPGPMPKLPDHNRGSSMSPTGCLMINRSGFMRNRALCCRYPPPSRSTMFQ